MNMTMIYLLISGGVLFLAGIITGVFLVRYGIGIGNRLTISGKEELFLGEDIISTNQGNTE